MISDEGYLEFIRGLPCCRCGAGPRSDPHHLVSRGWREPTRNDFYCIPLCRHCHTMLDHMEFKDWLQAFGTKQQIVRLVTEVADQLVRYFSMPKNEVGI